MLSETKTVRLQKLNITKTSYFNRKRFHCQASRKQNTRQKEDVLYQQWSHLSLLKQHWLNTPWRSSVTVVYLKYPTCTGCKTPLHLWINTVCPLILFEYFSLLSYLHWINYPSKSNIKHFARVVGRWRCLRIQEFVALLHDELILDL